MTQALTDDAFTYALGQRVKAVHDWLNVLLCVPELLLATKRQQVLVPAASQLNAEQTAACIYSCLRCH
jgi:hypothetical protein